LDFLQEVKIAVIPMKRMLVRIIFFIYNISLDDESKIKNN
jgi:hypothetical protein